MPLIITPSQMNQRAELYHQLGIMITAGLTVVQALQHLEKNPPSFSLRRPIAQLLEHLIAGDTVSQSVEKLGTWMPSFDIALIDAGERSGRLDAALKLLALHYRERAQMARQMISNMLYPVGLLNFSVLVFAFTDFLKSHSWLRFILTPILILGPIYAATFFIIYSCQGKHGEKWRGMVEKAVKPIPFVGKGRRYLALSRLAASLEALLNAGVSIISAWPLAATASGSAAITREVSTWDAPLHDGKTPSEMVSHSREFPELFANLYSTGEVSGQLDQTLGRLHTLYEEEGMSRLKAAAQWTPRLIYIAVVCFMVWKIIQFYGDQNRELNQIMDGMG